MTPRTLLIGCATCGGRLTAVVGPSVPESQPTTGQCPYCSTPQKSDFGGTLIWITKRAHDSGEEH